MRANLIMGVLVLWVTVGCARPTRQPVAAPTTQPDLATVLRGEFTAVFKDDFTIISDRLTVDQHNWRVWLVYVQPKRAGYFVVRHECQEVDTPPHMKLIEVGYTFGLQLGEKNTPRLAYGWPTPRYVWPAANVGDTVVLRFKIARADHPHRFYRTAADPERAVRKQAFWENSAKREADRPTKPFDLRNEADKLFTVVRTDANPSVMQRGDMVSYDLSALLEAQQPGRCNLQAFTSEKKPSEGQPVVVVPANRPITVVPMSADYTGKGQGTEELPQGPLVLRVGDRVWLRCWRYTTPINPDHPLPPPQHPQLTLTGAPFDFDATKPGYDWAPLPPNVP